MRPPRCASRAGAATSSDPHSMSERLIATCRTGMSRSTASTAEAYSHGSRTIRSGRHPSTALRISGSIEFVASFPNSSRLPSSDAVAASTTGSCSLIGAISASDGSDPPTHRWPARSTMARMLGGATTATSSPRRSAASSTALSGPRWPAPPSEQAPSTFTLQPSPGSRHHGAGTAADRA